MSYLLDTNILSETRRRHPVPGVAAWIAATPADELYVSVLSLGEIERGISRIRDGGIRGRQPPFPAGSGKYVPGLKSASFP